jgi:hypothetical protein
LLGNNARRALTVTFAGVAVFAAAATAALAQTETASSGAVTATFSFTAGAQNTYATKTLTISRSGQVVYDQPVASSYCGPGGRDEFITADDSFAYAFTDYADSGLPIKIVAFAGGRFTDVTRQHPKLIAADAARYLKAFKHDLGNGDGLIAAWAADEDNLGHTSLVASTLAKYLKAGELRSGNYPSAQKFIKALGKLLKKDGYVH